MKKSYHISDILSVTTGCLVSQRHMGGIYDILNFLTGDDLMTHQLPRAFDPCKAWLLAQHPALPADELGITRENYKEKLAEQIAIFGESLEIEPLPAGIWEHKDAIQEALERFGTKRVVIIGVGQP